MNGKRAGGTFLLKAINVSGPVLSDFVVNVVAVSVLMLIFYLFSQNF